MGNLVELSYSLQKKNSFKPANYCFFFVFQFLIVVVDSTDRERLAVTKAELYNMLNHEVRNIEKLYKSLQCV